MTFYVFLYQVCYFELILVNSIIVFMWVWLIVRM